MRISGGQELSREQLKSLEDDAKEEDEDEGEEVDNVTSRDEEGNMGIVKEESGIADVEEAQELPQNAEDGNDDDDDDDDRGASPEKSL